MQITSLYPIEWYCSFPVAVILVHCQTDSSLQVANLGWYVIIIIVVGNAAIVKTKQFISLT